MASFPRSKVAQHIQSIAIQPGSTLHAELMPSRLTKMVMTKVNRSFAEKHLPHPDRQRKMSEPGVQAVIKLIKEGKYMDGVDAPPVYLDSDGYIIDGQHRVTAIARTNTEFYLPVIHNAVLERIAQMVDQNRKRTIVDRVNMYGYTGYNKDKHQVNSFVYADDKGMRATSIHAKTSSDDPVVWIKRWQNAEPNFDQFSSVFNSRQDHNMKRGHKGVAIVLAVAIKAALAGYDKTELMAFWKAFINQDTTHAQARYALWLREIVVEYKAALDSDSYRKALFFLAQRAVSDFFSRKNKSAKYKLPLKEVTDITGIKSIILDSDKAVAFF